MPRGSFGLSSLLESFLDVVFALLGARVLIQQQLVEGFEVVGRKVVRDESIQRLIGDLVALKRQEGEVLSRQPMVRSAGQEAIPLLSLPPSWSARISLASSVKTSLYSNTLHF